MKPRAASILFATMLPQLSLAALPPAKMPVHRPKLILAIAVDQFRYDYTTRFRERYSGGLATMLSEGAVFVDAHQDHFPTVTATGHATFLTGSVPATSGIIGNEWYDRQLGKVISSVEDAETTLLSVEAVKEGSSPHNLVVSTLGDEIKMSHRGDSKVIGISMKDRAAILPSGQWRMRLTGWTGSPARWSAVPGTRSNCRPGSSSSTANGWRSKRWVQAGIRFRRKRHASRS